MTPSSDPRPLIRLASPGDSPAIARIVNAAYRPAESFFVVGERTTVADVDDLMQLGRFLVLVEDGGVCGCVYVEVRGERAYFGMLSVDPPRQGGGRARRLIAATEDACRAAGCRHLDLTVVDVRPELFAFYQGLGFAPTGEVLPWPPDEVHKLKQPAHFLVYTKPL